jgi:hypothetical protein
MQKTRRTQQYSSLIISIVQTEEKCLKIVTTISIEFEIQYKSFYLRLNNKFYVLENYSTYYNYRVSQKWRTNGALRCRRDYRKRQKNV